MVNTAVASLRLITWEDASIIGAIISVVGVATGRTVSTGIASVGVAVGSGVSSSGISSSGISSSGIASVGVAVGSGVSSSGISSSIISSFLSASVSVATDSFLYSVISVVYFPSAGIATATSAWTGIQTEVAIMIPAIRRAPHLLHSFRIAYTSLIFPSLIKIAIFDPENNTDDTRCQNMS